MNFPLKEFVLLAILLGSIGVAPVFSSSPTAQNSTGENYASILNSSVVPITVATDSQSYNDGNKITISGMTRDYISAMPITVIIRNPAGNIVMIAQVPLGTDKTYTTTVIAGGSLWQEAGTYEVNVTFGTQDRSAKTTFQFTGSKSTTVPPNSIAVEGTNFTVPYDITNGKILGMKTDSQSKSLLVAIQTTADGVLTITLPRTLIDAKAVNHDDQYYVLLDEREADFDETNTTPADRTLSIPFTDGTEEIEIIGTQVVPEFGLALSFVLAIAIITIIAISAKTELRFMPKY